MKIILIESDYDSFIPVTKTYDNLTEVIDYIHELMFLDKVNTKNVNIKEIENCITINAENDFNLIITGVDTFQISTIRNSIESIESISISTPYILIESTDTSISTISKYFSLKKLCNYITETIVVIIKAQITHENYLYNNGINIKKSSDYLHIILWEKDEFIITGIKDSEMNTIEKLVKDIDILKTMKFLEH